MNTVKKSSELPPHLLSSLRFKQRFDGALKRLMDKVEENQSTTSSQKSRAAASLRGGLTQRSTSSTRSLTRSISTSHSVHSFTPSQHLSEEEVDKRLTFAVLKKVQKFMHDKGYRLIDLFRDSHINTNAHVDALHDLEDDRGDWLIYGDHGLGRLSLNKKQLMHFFRDLGLHLTWREVAHIVHYIDIDGDGQVDVHELDVAVHKEHMEHIHEMDLLLDPMERLAEQIKLGKKKFQEDSHTRYRQRKGKAFLDSTAKEHFQKRISKQQQQLRSVAYRPKQFEVRPSQNGLT